MLLSIGVFGKDNKRYLTYSGRDNWTPFLLKSYNTSKLETLNSEDFLEIYRKHNREVIEYFKDQPGRLLVVNVVRGDGWGKFCPFLGCEVPEEEFPFVNKGKYK